MPASVCVYMCVSLKASDFILSTMNTDASHLQGEERGVAEWHTLATFLSCGLSNLHFNPLYSKKKKKKGPSGQGLDLSAL